MIDETTSNVRRTSAPSSRHVSGDAFERELISLIPQLRAFSRVLCRNRPAADDIVQDTLAKALRSRECFEPGTNMKAWLFTILRNTFYSGTRRSWRETEWNTELGEQIAGPANGQEWALGLSEPAVRVHDHLEPARRERMADRRAERAAAAGHERPPGHLVPPSAMVRRPEASMRPAAATLKE